MRHLIDLLMLLETPNCTSKKALDLVNKIEPSASADENTTLFLETLQEDLRGYLEGKDLSTEKAREKAFKGVKKAIKLWDGDYRADRKETLENFEGEKKKIERKLEASKKELDELQRPKPGPRPHSTATTTTTTTTTTGLRGRT